MTGFRFCEGPPLFKEDEEEVDVVPFLFAAECFDVFALDLADVVEVLLFR